jgi:molybdopterin synthase catalytic subunit
VYAAITAEPIRVADVLDHVGDAADGAVLLFFGTVRDCHEGRAVTGLHYDAYDAMALEVLQAIVREAAAQCGSDRIAVVHRTGELAVGEVSVAIAVSTPHRAEAYEASRTIIEQIKVRLPVWKQERYPDGAMRWLEGSIPPESVP